MVLRMRLFHAPKISLCCLFLMEEVWRTKWWAMHQFTFLCLVSEVNAVLVPVKNKITMPQLKFCLKLAQQMMEKTLDAPSTPVVAPVPIRRARSMNHRILKQKTHEGEVGIWIPTSLKGVDQLHLPEVPWMPKKCRTFCFCDSLMPLCAGFYALHCQEV